MIKYDKSRISDVIDLGDIFLKLSNIDKNEIVYYVCHKDFSNAIGYIDLRLNHNLSLYYYGNVGYRINEQYRGHGYAYIASEKIIAIAKEIGLDYLIFTCSPDNIASKKTIQKLGCIYIETVNVPIWHSLHKNEPIKEIYRIDL